MESTTHASPPARQLVCLRLCLTLQIAVFEVFPLVYPVYYGMSLGQMGLVFLCILTACILGVIAYSTCLYVLGRNGFVTQERRLLPALGFCFGPTIGLFLFAWTARASIHWMAPTIGITIYGASVFVLRLLL